jgi:ribonuclease HII
VVAAAVILPPDEPNLLKLLAGVRDSKQLPAGRRELLLEKIQKHSLAVGVGSSTPGEIDSLGIVPATRIAMCRAIESLVHPVDHLLLDHISLPEVPLPQISLAKGDALVLSISAASIVAKVSRDRMMAKLDAEFPEYGFAQHKGYGTRNHRAALGRYGPADVHRFSFAPMRLMVATKQEGQI